MAVPKRFIRDMQSRFAGLPDIKSGLQRTIRKRRKRPFEAEFEVLKALSPKGRCAIDVGANRGQSIDAIRLYHPSVHIHSFEPNGALFTKLNARFGPDENLTLHNVGLGNREAKATLHVPYYRSFLYDGLSSFSKERAESWLNAQSVWRFKSELLRIEAHTCHIEVLDKYALEPFFLKIHVQGFELDVLRGAKQTIESYDPVLLMANNEDADIWLRNAGWTQCCFTGSKLIELPQNDLSLYNCVYLNLQKQEHRDIMMALT